jgi:hypothetical protein
MRDERREKMPRYLVTPSLYSSWSYYRNSDDQTKNDFLATLRNDKFEPNESMQKGIDLEDDVVAVTRGISLHEESDFELKDNDYVECCERIADIVRGGLYQERVYKPAMIGPYDVLLYARADFIKRDYGYDVKYAKSYEIGKYAGSIQHDLTMKCAGVPRFSYLICDGHHFYEEKYNRSMVSDEILHARVYAMLFDIFEDKEFSELYRKNWESFPDTKAA